jgi:hypothetical protein
MNKRRIIPKEFRPKRRGHRRQYLPGGLTTHYVVARWRQHAQKYSAWFSQQITMHQAVMKKRVALMSWRQRIRTFFAMLWKDRSAFWLTFGPSRKAAA